MKSTALWVLALVNALLLATLLDKMTPPNAAMAARAKRPDLLMVPGDVIGGNSSVVYLIDSANRRIGAVALNNAGRGLVGMPPLDMNRVFEDAPAGRGGNKR